jgi:hypothetical protein
MASEMTFRNAYAPEPDSIDLLPAGWYPAQVTESEIKPTKSGNGKLLEVEFTILDGRGKGRKVWSRFNFINPSAEAQRIGLQQIRQLCEAIGLNGIERTTAELHNKPLAVFIAVEESKDPKYPDPKNKTTRFAVMSRLKELQGGVRAKPAGAAPATTGQADVAQDAGGKAAPPWMRRQAA